MKKDIARLQAHEFKIVDAIDKFELTSVDLKVSNINIENDIKRLVEGTKNIRKLEDRSLLGDIIEKVLWIAIGAFVTIIIHQNYIATREKKDYKIEKKSER